jgi:bacterioferritin-associated ferredoxin
MQADDELCLCFHISCRKVLNYIRIHRVKLPSQLAECGGAGTGCGWCRKQMQKLLSECEESPPSALEIESWLEARTPQKHKYSEGRAKYRAALPSGASSNSGPANSQDCATSDPGLDTPVDKDLPDMVDMQTRFEPDECEG